MTIAMMMVLMKSFSANLLIMALCFYCSILFRDNGVECVRIKNVSPPQLIESSSSESVVLDCQFETGPDDNKLVVKWYHEHDPMPIYQWIPSLSDSNRKYSSKFEPFVDKNYSVDDKLTRFRAIRLINPPYSLSGDYTCSVSSLHSQDSQKTQLIIYVTAKSFHMSVTEVDNGINITCSATGLYPEPEMTLYRIKPSNQSYTSEPIEVTDRVTTSVLKKFSGQYSISLTSQIYEDSSLAIDVTEHYECRLKLPNTTYIETKRIALQAGWHTRTNSISRGSFKESSLPLILVLPLLEMMSISYSLLNVYDACWHEYFYAYSSKSSLLRSKPKMYDTYHPRSPSDSAMLEAIECHNLYRYPSADINKRNKSYYKRIQEKVLIVALGGISTAIRLISITVPKQVIIKGNATLYCNYNIESDQLYSLKWYKRINHTDEEFFSYISSPEKTNHKNYLPGVDLDEMRSSKTGEVIYLYKISEESEGYYKCEVSADYTFQTVKLDSYMTVLVPPTKPPIIHGYKAFYSVGELVTSYCNASYSKPKSRLKWFINEVEASDDYLLDDNSDEPISGIRFRLKREHLREGKLRLRCTAYIDSNFQVSSEEAVINGTNELQNVPLITGLESNYILGQYLDVNCTMPSMIDDSSESRLEWFIHNQKANPEFVKRYSIKNTIGLRFHIKQYHLDDNSSLFIKCSATQLVQNPKTQKYDNPRNSYNPMLIRGNHFYLIYLLLFISCLTD